MFFKTFKQRLFTVLITVLCTVGMSKAQIKKDAIKLGFAYGVGSQNKFPFNLEDYTHTVDFYKILINYSLKQKGRWSFELQIEPGINIAEHQLLNKWYVRESEWDNYLELRDLFTQKRTITEYVLNLGFLVRYTIYKDLSAYAIGSVGPMISDKPTERLAKGYAFSDVFGLGLSYSINKVQFNIRGSVRHTSNLKFKKPNSGHNTTNIEFGALFQL